MTWTSIFVPNIWPMAATLFLMALLAGYSWRRRSVPGALPFMISCLFTLLVIVGILMAELAVDADTRLVWQKFKNAWMLPAATAITCFILEYAWPRRWLTKRNLVLLSFMPSLGVLYLLTNRFFQLISPSFRVSQILAESFGPVGGILFAYSLILSFIDLTVLIWLYIHSPQHRWPVFLIVTGQVIARVLLVARFPEVDGSLLLVLSFTVPFTTFAIVLFRFRMFDPIPLARQTAIDQLHTGMMVLDPQGRVVSLNQAAEKILRVTTREAKGRLVREWLPVYPETAQPLPDDFETEVSLGEGAAQRYFTLSSSLLKDFRGLAVGSLLMLRDITEQKQTQARILEQQRALATLQERERLAREMHDGIGQVLGYVKMQAQAARDRLTQGQTAEVDGQLAQLITVAQDAHADVREYILGAKAAASGHPGEVGFLPGQVSFLPRLRQFLKRFSEVYGLRAELIELPDWSDDLLEPTVEVQFMRIIQEALTNVRKHARATCVQVILQPNGSRAQVTIQDDGIGFDPALVPEGMGQGYGLGFLRERAAEVGGSVAIHSAPGQGTQIIVDVPRSV